MTRCCISSFDVIAPCHASLPKFWRGMLRDQSKMICWPEMTPVVRLNMVPCKNAAQRPIAWRLATHFNFSSIPTSQGFGTCCLRHKRCAPLSMHMKTHTLEWRGVLDSWPQNTVKHYILNPWDICRSQVDHQWWGFNSVLWCVQLELSAVNPRIWTWAFWVSQKHGALEACLPRAGLGSGCWFSWLWWLVFDVYKNWCLWSLFGVAGDKVNVKSWVLFT